MQQTLQNITKELHVYKVFHNKNVYLKNVNKRKIWQEKKTFKTLYLYWYWVPVRDVIAPTVT